MKLPGVDIRVSTESRQGGRKYMEDVLDYRFHKRTSKHEFEFAYFGVFDGHGGAEAAKFAKDHIFQEITKQKGFWHNDDAQVMKAIKEGFISTHKLMGKAINFWPRTIRGLPSTAGTTASVVFIRKGKVYVGHVGDSGIVMGMKKNDSTVTARCITVDHKPESPKEKKRIESNGGQVIAKSGVQRVVWKRPRLNHRGPVRRSTHMDQIPFLAVARALGDLWSYNSAQDVFVVSPEPDVVSYKLDLKKHKSIILASDGLWNMVHPHEAAELADQVGSLQSLDDIQVVSPAHALVHLALERWNLRSMRADNTSVIVVYLDPPRPAPTAEQPKSSLSRASTITLSDGESLPDSGQSSYDDLELGQDIEVSTSVTFGASPDVLKVYAGMSKKPTLKRSPPKTFKPLSTPTNFYAKKPANPFCTPEPNLSLDIVHKSPYKCKNLPDYDSKPISRNFPNTAPFIANIHKISSSRKRTAVRDNNQSPSKKLKTAKDISDLRSFPNNITNSHLSPRSCKVIQMLRNVGAGISACKSPGFMSPLESVCCGSGPDLPFDASPGVSEMMSPIWPDQMTSLGQSKSVLQSPAMASVKRRLMPVAASKVLQENSSSQLGHKRSKSEQSFTVKTWGTQNRSPFNASRKRAKSLEMLPGSRMVKVTNRTRYRSLSHRTRLQLRSHANRFNHS